MNAGDLKISHSLQDVARELSARLAGIAGERVDFSLFVWTHGRAQYVSSAQRASVIEAVEEIIAMWKAGMPDVPAHEVRG